MKIACVGDSIGAGAQTSARYFNDDRVSNTFLGYICETLESQYGCKADPILLSEDGKGRQYLTEAMSSIIAVDPDIVMIEFGMNDHTEDDDSVESFKQDIGSGISELKKNNIDVIVVGFFKQNPEWVKEDPNRTVDYNNALRDAAQENDVYFADVDAKFDEVADIKNIYEDVTVDYMHHPSDWGHELYATSIMPVLNINDKFDPMKLKYYIE